MRTYKITSVSGEVTRETWNSIPKTFVDISPWEEHPSPYRTEVQLTYNDEYLFVHLKTDETNIRAVQTKRDSQVCEDSCMEFFFSPDADDERYFNFEINPNGTLLVFVCNRRITMNPVPEDEKIFNIESVVSPDGWELYYKIPFSFMKKYFAKVSPVMRANFYKCGEKTNPEHYACWSRIPKEIFDFHTPQFFGEICFE